MSTYWLVWVSMVLRSFSAILTCYTLTWCCATSLSLSLTLFFSFHKLFTKFPYPLCIGFVPAESLFHSHLNVANVNNGWCQQFKMLIVMSKLCTWDIKVMKTSLFQWDVVTQLLNWVIHVWSPSEMRKIRATTRFFKRHFQFDEIFYSFFFTHSNKKKHNILVVFAQNKQVFEWKG